LIVNIIEKIYKLPLRIFYVLVGKFFSADDRIATRLFDYFPSYLPAFKEAMNQFYRILRKDRAYDVQGIVIEPTNLCNLRCAHCSTQNLPDDKKGNMDFELFKSILDNNPQLTCLILTRNGEPLLHPKIFDMIEYARSRRIYVNMYTNGMCLDEDRIGEIFKSGLNELNFSMEGIGDFYKENRGKDYKIIESIINKVLDERKKRVSSLKMGINAVIAKDPSYAEEVKKVWGDLVDSVTIEPLMGSRAIPRKASCKTLWRNLVVTWNGDVVPCCSDMEASMVIGNVTEKSLKDIFNGEPVKELRQMHLRGDYPTTCKYCDSYFG